VVHRSDRGPQYLSILLAQAGTVEFAPREWVAWYNGSRLLESRNELSGKPGMVPG
jgi:hypothetical protein